MIKVKCRFAVTVDFAKTGNVNSNTLNASTTSKDFASTARCAFSYTPVNLRKILTINHRLELQTAFPFPTKAPGKNANRRTVIFKIDHGDYGDYGKGEYGSNNKNNMKECWQIGYIIISFF